MKSFIMIYTQKGSGSKSSILTLRQIYCGMPGPPCLVVLSTFFEVKVIVYLARDNINENHIPELECGNHQTDRHYSFNLPPEVEHQMKQS